MNSELITALAGPAGTLILLAAMLLWYLPGRDRCHAATVERVNAAHTQERHEDHDRLDQDLRENGRQVKALARAVLIASLISAGRPPAEAEAEARRIIIANGGES